MTTGWGRPELPPQPPKKVEQVKIRLGKFSFKFDLGNVILLSVLLYVVGTFTIIFWFHL